MKYVLILIVQENSQLSNKKDVLTLLFYEAE
jgi:hypothetical protein